MNLYRDSGRFVLADQTANAARDCGMETIVAEQASMESLIHKVVDITKQKGCRKYAGQTEKVTYGSTSQKDGARNPNECGFIDIPCFCTGRNRD